MKINNFIYKKNLYIFFIFLSLIIFFFSTEKLEAKVFNINNIEISKPFEINFNKNKVIDEGFRKAFFELTSLTTKTSDQIKIKKVRLNEIKGMIDSFSIKEEKFIDEIYYVNLGVSFNKKKFFSFLEKKNIFPSTSNKKKFLFIPIIIDENKKDLLIYSENKFYNEWNSFSKNYHLINYILPTEDLEDLNLIKKNYGNIEDFNFKEITNKYNLENSIVALIFKNEKEMRVLSKISIKDNINIKNQSFSNINLNDKKQLENIINQLKIIYEDYWKDSNRINTSIKLLLTIEINSSNENKIRNFEKVLNDTDLIYSFNISKFNKDSIFYKIIFNGTPDIFLKSMNDNKFDFDTQKKTWVLK
tara:strand:- start:958 stop:2034 length:1077 start_codon:yes stop_codon:yes gene_type:complete